MKISKMVLTNETQGVILMENRFYNKSYDESKILNHFKVSKIKIFPRSKMNRRVVEVVPF